MHEIDNIQHSRGNRAKASLQLDEAVRLHPDPTPHATAANAAVSAERHGKANA